MSGTAASASASAPTRSTHRTRRKSATTRSATVADQLARTTGTHGPQPAQQPQLMRDRRLAHLQHGGEIADAQLGMQERMQDAHACRLGQRLEVLGDLNCEIVVDRMFLDAAYGI